MNTKQNATRSEDWHLYVAVPKSGVRFKVGIAATANRRLRKLDLTDLDMSRSLFLSGARSLISRAERALHFFLDPWHSPLEQQQDGYTEWFEMAGVSVARDQLAGLASRDDRMALFSIVFLPRTGRRATGQDETELEPHCEAVEPSFYVLNANGIDGAGFGCMPSELDNAVDRLAPGDILVFRRISSLICLGPAKIEAIFERIRLSAARVGLLGVLDPEEIRAASEMVANGMQAALRQILLGVNREHHETCRKRQEQGIAIAKQKGIYTGRKADAARHELIHSLRASGHSIAETARLAKCSQSLVKLVRKSTSDEAAG